MSEVFEVNDENFQEKIAAGITLVDFYATWCGPCKMVAPILEELATELKGEDVHIGKLDIDHNLSTSQKYHVTSVPTLILFKDGKEVDRLIGAHDKERIRGHISKAQES